MKTLHDDRLDEKQLSTRTAFEGRLLHLFVDKVGLPNGNESTREYILHQGAVGILSVLEDGSMVFVKQFRYPVHSVIYEIPAGKLEKGEEILPSAQRELSEETGLTADHWTRMTSIVTTPGFTNETIHLFLATGLHKGEMHPDADEFLQVEVIPEEKVKQMVLSEDIFDAKTLSALLLYFLTKKAC